MVANIYMKITEIGDGLPRDNEVRDLLYLLRYCHANASKGKLEKKLGFSSLCLAGPGQKKQQRNLSVWVFFSTCLAEHLTI